MNTTSLHLLPFAVLEMVLLLSFLCDSAVVHSSYYYYVFYILYNCSCFLIFWG